jgi:hypothetical protein
MRYGGANINIPPLKTEHDADAIHWCIQFTSELSQLLILETSALTPNESRNRTPGASSPWATRHQKQLFLAATRLPQSAADSMASCGDNFEGIFGGRYSRPSDRTLSQSKLPTDVRPRQSLLAGLRFHDLRHHAITELAESQVSDQTIMAVAGHISHRMPGRYSHVRGEARRQAVSALSARPTGAWFRTDRTVSYDTNNDTNASGPGTPATEVVEEMVGSWGLEPQTSTVSRWRSNQLSYEPNVAESISWAI